MAGPGRTKNSKGEDIETIDRHMTEYEYDSRGEDIETIDRHMTEYEYDLAM